MKRPAPMSASLAFCIASLLAGCEASQSISPASISQSEATSNAANTRSWTMRGAKDNALLYVNADNASAGGGKVFAYTYPGGKLVGTLGAFGNPAGLCSDTAGRVYVTVGGFEGMNPSVQEYSHDGRWLAYVNVPAPWASN